MNYPHEITFEKEGSAFLPSPLEPDGSFETFEANDLTWDFRNAD
jgi:hypothetical protein